MTLAVEARARDLRIGGAALLAAATAWPLLPIHPTVACPLRTLTGIPCPLCGMTRACVAAAHGDIGASLRYNPGGILVMMLAVIVVLGPERLQRVRAPAWVAGVVLGALWVWNVGFNPTFHQLLLR